MIPLSFQAPGIFAATLPRPYGPFCFPIKESGQICREKAAPFLQIKECLGLKKLCIRKQVHETSYCLIRGEEEEFTAQSADILLTKSKCTLGIMHADCQAAIFYDPVQRALAAVHAGWRGQGRDIYQVVVDLLEKHFGSNRRDIHVHISASLGPCHAQFLRFKEELPPSFWDFQEESFYFNLWRIAESQLVKAGLLHKHIHLLQICTYCDEQFYSYRRSHLAGTNNLTIARLI